MSEERRPRQKCSIGIDCQSVRAFERSNRKDGPALGGTLEHWYVHTTMYSTYVCVFSFALLHDVRKTPLRGTLAALLAAVVPSAGPSLDVEESILATVNPLIRARPLSPLRQVPTSDLSRSTIRLLCVTPDPHDVTLNIRGGCLSFEDREPKKLRSKRDSDLAVGRRLGEPHDLFNQVRTKLGKSCFRGVFMRANGPKSKVHGYYKLNTQVCCCGCVDAFRPPMYIVPYQTSIWSATLRDKQDLKDNHPSQVHTEAVSPTGVRSNWPRHGRL